MPGEDGGGGVGVGTTVGDVVMKVGVGVVVGLGRVDVGNIVGQMVGVGVMVGESHGFVKQVVVPASDSSGSSCASTSTTQRNRE